MVQYFQRKPTQQEEARNPTRRGRVLTTVPRLIELDIMRLYKKRKENGIEKRVTSVLERNRIKGILGIENLTNGTELLILRRKAQNRTLWECERRHRYSSPALAAWTKKMGDKSAKRREIRDNQNERVQQEIDNAAPVDMPGAHV
jgi:hypothetical protein